MLTFLTMLACSQPEAAEPPLPPGAAQFRATLQSFQAIRMWIRAPEFNGLTDGKFWFGKRFILSFRRAVVTCSSASANTPRRAT